MARMVELLAKPQSMLSQRCWSSRLMHLSPSLSLYIYIYIYTHILCLHETCKIDREEKSAQQAQHVCCPADQDLSASL